VDTLQQYEGRQAHWVRRNHTERMPHRWIVADSEAIREATSYGEQQTLRCVDAVRWRDDLKTGTHDEWHSGENLHDFWEWCDQYTKSGSRTVVWFHNASYDLRTLDAFRALPALGWSLEWCNLDRDVSVVSWRSDHGTLLICDTFTWTGKGLSELSGMVGIGKPRLPDNDDSLAAWHSRCEADVQITRQVVTELLDFVRGEHLGNWQPSGAGQAYAAWRHRFMAHKVLVHDDAPALAAERVAMHAGRAEAWYHGKAPLGPFTEWDMHMSYCRIAAECDVPVKLFAFDNHPSKAVHEWAGRHWTLLCEVEVTTDVPCVPCKSGDRTLWPVGTFTTTLWQPELELLRQSGGSYRVLRQWRYNMAPALQEWAQWSMGMCAADETRCTPVQKTFTKHQSRALIGRLALRNASWLEWGANPYGWCGLTDYVDGETGETSRMMHVGDKTFMEGAAVESQNSLPQITGYIMAVARVRLWEACQAAGAGHVVHVDTDSLICDRHGSASMAAAAAAGLPGGWRPKDHWSSIDVTGPRHYRASGRRVIPGVPRTAQETSPGVFRGEVWESLAASLQDSRSSTVRIYDREWRPRLFDGRRPWTVAGPAEPPRLPRETQEGNAHDQTGSADRATGGVAPRNGRTAHGRRPRAGGRHRQRQDRQGEPRTGGADYGGADMPARQEVAQSGAGSHRADPAARTMVTSGN
jgi:hypothetical protein